MEIDLDLLIKVTVPLGTLVLGKYLDRYLAKQPKLITYLGHASAFTLRGEKPTVVHTHAIVVRNAGRLAANNVRIGHYVLPDNFQVLPSVPHSVEQRPSGGADIVILKLVPQEQITISYLYMPPLYWNQVNEYTKSDEGYAKVLHVLPTPRYPKWVSRAIWTLVFIGAASLMYLAVEIVRSFLPRG